MASTIEYEEAKRMVDNYDIISTTLNNHHRQQQRRPRQITYFVKEYEIKNRPVKIVGATEGWLAMPSYSFDDTTIARLDRLPAQVHDINDNNSINNDASTLWRDVGDKSLLFHGGGKGGWT